MVDKNKLRVSNHQLKLKHHLTYYTIMATLSQDIQSIRSLRKDIRNPKLHPTILKSIETIQNCIMSGTDQNGWKKVDWRSNSSTHRNSAPSSQKQTFFSSRPQSSNLPNYSSHNSFSNRSKNHYHSRDQPVSIPLTNTLPEKTISSHTDDDSFEIVRHGRRFHNQHHQHHHEHSSEHSSKSSTEFFRSPPPPKYVSKFKKSSDKVEDTILNTILLGKLNKFSPSNYNDIKEFIIQIISDGQTEMIKCFMKLVFEKAASEEIYCPLYAKLLSELSSHYPVLLTEMANLYSQYMLIFDEVNDGTNENYNELCQRNIEKKYRRGYSQFLAELIKHNVIDTDVFIKTINKIITQVELNQTLKDSIKLIEEFADCLMKIMKAIQSTSSDDDDEKNESDSSRIRSIIKEQLITRIHTLTLRNPDNIGLSNKARFTFLDIYEGIQKFN